MMEKAKYDGCDGASLQRCLCVVCYSYRCSCHHQLFSAALAGRSGGTAPLAVDHDGPDCQTTKSRYYSTVSVAAEAAAEVMEKEEYDGCDGAIP